MWFVETVKRKAYALNPVGHGGYILFLFSFMFDIITDIAEWSQRSALEKAFIISLVGLAAFSFYYFTIKKIEITQYH